MPRRASLGRMLLVLPDLGRLRVSFGRSHGRQPDQDPGRWASCRQIGTSRADGALWVRARRSISMGQPDQDQIQPPGSEAEITPQADHGEESYRGCDKLTGRAAVITGGDSG